MPSLTCADCEKAGLIRYIPRTVSRPCPVAMHTWGGNTPCRYTPAQVQYAIAQIPARLWQRIRKLKAVLALMEATPDAQPKP